MERGSLSIQAIARKLCGTLLFALERIQTYQSFCILGNFSDLTLHDHDWYINVPQE